MHLRALLTCCAVLLFACSTRFESRPHSTSFARDPHGPPASLREAVWRRDAQAIRRLAPDAGPPELEAALRKAALLNHLECARVLIECGASPSAADVEGNTPLHRVSSDQMVRLLTQAGADVQARNHEGRGVGRLDMLQLGAACARRIVHALDQAGAPRDLLTAVQVLDCADVERLLAAKPRLEPGVLHYAAARGDVGIVQALLAAGADPEQRCDSRFSNVDEWGPGALGTAVQRGRFEVAELLLRSGARPKGDGWPDGRHGRVEGGLLERAAADGPVTFVAMLLAAGLEPDRPSTRDGEDTALGQAANHGREDTVRLLLAHGADPNRVSGGASPLMHAAVMAQETVADLLLAAGARATVLEMAGLGRADHVRRLAAEGGQVEERDRRCDMTPLHWAVALGHRETVAALLAAGAAVDRRSGDEAEWHTGAVWRKTRAFRAFAPTGISPIGRAVELKFWDIVTMLVEAGATTTEEEIGTLAAVPGPDARRLLAFLLERRGLDAERGCAALHGVLTGELDAAERRARFHLLLEAGVDRHFGCEASKCVLRDADPDSVAPLVGEMRRRGWTGDLGAACTFGWLAEARMLLHGVPEDFDTWPCQMAAFFADQPEVLHLLRECVRADAWQPREAAAHAAWDGAPRVLVDLLSRGLISVEDCGADAEDLMSKAASNGRVSVLEVLVRLGIDVNGGYEGFSPLIRAAMGAHLQAIEFLIRHGADVNACSDNGKTALSEVLRSSKHDRNTIACVRALLAAGADPVEGDVIATLESFASWVEPPDVAESFAQLARECLERAARWR